MRTTNYTELRKNLKSCLDSVVEDKVPLIVSRPGAESVVLISLDDYVAMAETEYLLRDAKLMEELSSAEDDVANGNVTEQREGETVDDFLNRLSCTD